MKIKRYTLRDHIISFLIGVLLATPVCVGVYASLTDESVKATPVEVRHEVSAVVSDVVTTTREITTEKIKREYMGTFEITAYCACESCCNGSSDGLTYTETVATEGRTIAVDPDVIPLGSIIEINGVNYVAEDIGGAIKSNRIDIFFNSHSKAREFGRQYLDVFIIGSKEAI